MQSTLLENVESHRRYPCAMLEESWKTEVQNFDERRDIAIPGNREETIHYCVEQFIEIANSCIEKQGYFSVALSGGSTPKAIYQALSSPKNRNRIDWTKVLLFWSDERNVPPNHQDSNYKMVMDANFSSLPLKKENIFRMKAENNLEQNALDYEKLIQKHVLNESFDMVLLGMGDDGHVASLFPMTHGLNVHHRLVISNFIPQKETWRMTLTFECINKAQHILLYVLGKEKQKMVEQVFLGPYNPNFLPAQKVGTPLHHALWIFDLDAAALLKTNLEM